ncbi:MAG TPA: carbohydrate ABC transporter substrate-binding protein, partial [Lachnospiraceae bacterium]|nr:carbohydrate ABC transporter substrate-binding protein [Lachnospiraceae bacterium]
MKKQISLVLAAATVCSTLSAGAAAPVFAGDKVSFTIFNSKSELEEYLEEAAEEYGEENDVDIEVYYSQDTV